VAPSMLGCFIGALASQTSAKPCESPMLAGETLYREMLERNQEKHCFPFAHFYFGLAGIACGIATLLRETRPVRRGFLVRWPPGASPAGQLSLAKALVTYQAFVRAGPSCLGRGGLSSAAPRKSSPGGRFYWFGSQTG